MVDLSEKAVRQNLRDAGCDNKTIQLFFQCRQEGNFSSQLSLLSAHRQELLAALHREEKRIDCLDYLIYLLQKTENTSEQKEEI